MLAEQLDATFTIEHGHGTTTTVTLRT